MQVVVVVCVCKRHIISYTQSNNSSINSPLIFKIKKVRKSDSQIISLDIFLVLP